MLYTLLILKRILEDIFILPFVWWGRYLSAHKPLKEQYELFLIFPFYHIGGAEKVHAQIAAVARGKKCLVIFTRKSQNDLLLPQFKAAGHTIIDISFYTDNKTKYWNNLIYRGILSAHINKQPGKVMVFNGQSNFAYKLSRWIRHDIPQIELIHSLSSFSYIRIPFIRYYRDTIMISKNRISDHLELYRKFGIPETYDSRIKYILNGIPLPTQTFSKQFTGKGLNILYAGRDSIEKRVHIVRKIGMACIVSNLPVTVSYMGDVSGVIKTYEFDHEKFYGNVADTAQLNHIYESADVLLITSSEEGFPMVVMEGMARGCIILATPVGDMPVHIREGINGFLFSQVENEEKIIEEAQQLISKLVSDPVSCSAISENNIQYARTYFGLDKFEQHYQKLFDQYLL